MNIFPSNINIFPGIISQANRIKPIALSLSRFQCFFSDFSDFWFKMYFLLTRKCRIPPCNPHLAVPPFPSPTMGASFGNCREAHRTESGVKKGRCECSFSCCSCFCTLLSVCVCIFYARLRFCMQINQRRPVTCRIWALAEALARQRRGAGALGDGRNWRLKAGCSAQKHISHYLSH